MGSVFGAVQLVHLDPPGMTRNSVSPCQEAFTASHLPNARALQPPFTTVAAQARVWYNEAHYTLSRRRLNHEKGCTTRCVRQADLQMPADFDYFELLNNYAVFLPSVLRAY